MPRGGASFDVGVNGADRVIRGLSRLERDAPEIAEAQSSRVAEFFMEEVRKQIINTFEWHNGSRMARGLKMAQRRTGGRFASGHVVYIDAPMENGRGDYAAWHQNADTGHWVGINEENYPINEWADDVGLPDAVRAIYVTPQPFMDSAVRRGIRRMSSFVDRGGSVPDFLDQAGF